MGSDDKRWWDIISVACKPGAGEAAWSEGLHRELCKLPVDEILAFDRWFEDRACDANRHDLIVAKYYATGFGGDDGMYYFRCWLVAQGRTAYYNALANADSLADLDLSDDAEAEIFGAAQRAWATVTGRSTDDYDPGVSEQPIGNEMTGEVWDDDDPAEMQRRLPRLVAKYGGQYE